mmetsp:Transcript_64275/g.150966  ORF Transcript_64275/g.150966 Transcript_64275/m.150966 type:complete len:108 (-) Transcript_64275:732-1055(-)
MDGLCHQAIQEWMNLPHVKHVTRNLHRHHLGGLLLQVGVLLLIGCHGKHWLFDQASSFVVQVSDIQGRLSTVFTFSTYFTPTSPFGNGKRCGPSRYARMLGIATTCL